MLKKEKIAKYVAIPFAVLAVSTAAILIKLSNSHPVAISFYRMGFSTLIFFVPFWMRRRKIKKLDSKDLYLSILAGFILAFHFAFWIYSLELTTVASSVVLVSSHPLLVLFISDKFFGENINKKAYFAVVFALIGVFLIFISDLRVENWSVWGDLFALIGMVLLGFYLSIGKVVREEVPTVIYVFLAYGFASVVLAILSLFVGTSFKVYSLGEYGVFLALAIVPTLFGHTVYNWSLRYVQADLVSISLLGEPILSSFLALIFLFEIPPLLTIFGGAITIIGIYLSLLWR